MRLNAEAEFGRSVDCSRQSVHVGQQVANQHGCRLIILVILANRHLLRKQMSKGRMAEAVPLLSRCCNPHAPRQHSRGGCIARREHLILKTLPLYACASTCKRATHVQQRPARQQLLQLLPDQVEVQAVAVQIQPSQAGGSAQPSRQGCLVDVEGRALCIKMRGASIQAWQRVTYPS